MATPSFDEFAGRAKAKYPQATEDDLRAAYKKKYGGVFDPVRTQGPSREEFAAKARQKYGDIPDDQIDQAYEKKYGAGFLNETKRTIMSQAIAPMIGFGGATLAGLDTLFSGVPSGSGQEVGTFYDAGMGLMDYAEQMRRNNARSADLGTSSDWRPANIVQNTAGALGQVGTMIATGGAGIAALTVDDAGHLAQELMREGMSEEEAFKRAAAYAVASGALEKAGLDTIAGKIPGFGRIPGKVMAGLGEAGTELAQNSVRNLAAGEGPVEGFSQAVAQEGVPAFLAGAIFGKNRGRAQSSDQQARDWAKEAGIDMAAVDAADTPVPEAESDIRAQMGELGKSRRGVYLAPGQTGEFEGIKVPVPGGGELLVANEQDAQEAVLRFQSEPRQTVLGDFTGAGQGKPADGGPVVQVVDDQGNVLREGVVRPEDAQDTAARWEQEVGGKARILAPQEALRRRQDTIAAETLEKEKKLPKRGGIDRNRPYPPVAPGIQPAEPGEGLEYTPQGDLVVPRGAPFQAAPEDTVNLLESGVIPGTGELPQVGQDRDLEPTLHIPKSKQNAPAIELEKGLTREQKLDLAAQARDAEAYLPEFTQKLQDVAESVVGNRASVFGEFQPGALVAPVKSSGKDGWARVVEKVVLEEGGNTKLKDFGRATILVNNQQEAQAALDGILATFGQAPGTSIRRGLLDARTFDDVVAADPYGYTDIKVNVPGPNGRIYEVQVTTPELFKLKEFTGHKFYEEGRKRAGEFRTKFEKIVGRKGITDPGQAKRSIDALERMFIARDPAMKQLFEQSQKVYRPGFESLFAASQSASNSSSEISTPSLTTPDGMTGLNAPPMNLSASVPESPTSPGAPSTLKNLGITSSSNQNVARMSQGLNSLHAISVPGTDIEFEVVTEVAELSSLLASNQEGYDQRKQPRDREGRAALQIQAEKIGAELNPNLLLPSRSTADGAPVVGPDNMVESGNGRVMGLRLAIAKHPQNWQRYVQRLQAEGFNVDGFEYPVLIQRRVTPMTDDQVIGYTQAANARSNAGSSRTEQAKMDARLLDESVLSKINSGDMSQEQNVTAISGFFSKLPAGELPNLVDAKGNPNADGQKRAEAALVAKAYGNANGIDALLDRLYEIEDEGVRRLTNALRQASYKMAELRLGLDTGRVPAEYDLAQDVVNAYNAFRKAKRAGDNPAGLLKQADLAASPNQEAVLRLFFKPDGKEQPTETVASQLIYYAQQAQQQRTDQGGMFGETVLVPPSDILEAARKLVGDPQPTAPDAAGKFARQGGKYREGGMQAWGVSQIVDGIARKWNTGPRIRVVQDAGELPPEVLAALGPNINGATDLNTGTIYLVANNIPDTWAAQRVLLHEAVGHFAFDRLYGDRFKKLVDQINALSNKDPTVRRIGSKIDRVYGDLTSEQRAAEVVAHLAETNPKHPLARKIIAQFREILRAMGFKINLSKNDLVYMIRKAADSMVDKTPQQIQLGRELKPSSYEPKRGVESERNLIAQHNLSEKNLRHVLERFDGQLPVPSIGVTKIDQPLEGFGEITLLGDSTLIDPRGPNRTQVFGADIYSPRYPRVTRVAPSNAVWKEFKEDPADFTGLYPERVADQLLSRFLDSPQTTLEDIGVEFADTAEGLQVYLTGRLGIPHQEVKRIRKQAIAEAEERLGTRIYAASPGDHFYHFDPAVRKAFRQRIREELGDQNADSELEDGGIYRTTKRGRDVADYLAYRFGKIPYTEKILKGYDEQLGTPRYVAHTLDNVVRMMKKELRGGESSTNLYGIGQVRAHIAPQFTSRKNLTQEKARLIPSAEFEKIKEKVDQEVSALTEELFGTDFRSMQNMSDFLVDAARGGPAYAYRKTQEFNIPAKDTPELRQRVKDFIETLRAMPTTYFEAKITKPVPVEQFKAAVVPSNLSSDVREALERRGIKLYDYEWGEEKSRAAAIQIAARNTPDALFAKREERLDQQGRPIPEGQQELPGLDTEQPPKQQEELTLQRPEGIVGKANQIRGQRGLFASAIAEDVGQQTMPGVEPPPGPTPRVEVGGGDYSMAQFGRLSENELRVMQSVLGNLDTPVEQQRRGTQTWTETERKAMDLVAQRTGITLETLVGRKPGSTANAEQLEAYGMLLGKATRELYDHVKTMQREPSSAELARLAELKEKLGMMLAPAMGYRTEAGRALNILRKMSGDLKNADGVLAALGDGSVDSLKRFAEVVRETNSPDQVIGVTQAAYHANWFDKFYEVWVNGLLSGPTTHVVNLTSNALYQTMESVAELGASLVSKDVSTKAALARLAAIPHGFTLGLKNAAIAFKEERSVLTQEDKLETSQEKHKAIGGMAGRVIRLPGSALQMGDEMFKALAYQGELAALAMDEAVRSGKPDTMAEFQKIMGSINTRKDLVERAKKHAARMTFTTPMGPAASTISRLANFSVAGARPLRMIVPFIRTPTNILLEATKFTPLAPALKQVRNELSGGGRDAALGYARMATGSALMSGIVGMMAQGLMSGAGPDDKEEKDLLMRQGWQPYSIRIGDKWISYSRFDPASMIVGMTADLFEISSVMSDADIGKVSSMLMTSLARNLGEKTFLRGIFDFSNAVSDPDRFMESWVAGMAGTMKPYSSLLGQVARYQDPYLREARTIMDRYKAGIPGMTQDLAKRLDIAGDPIQREGAIPGNPMKMSTARPDPLASTMLELGVDKAAPSRRITMKGQSYELQGPQYESMKGYIQKARWSQLTPYVNSPQFKELKATQPLVAAAKLEQLWSKIGSQARKQWLFQNPGALTDPKTRKGPSVATSYQLN